MGLILEAKCNCGVAKRLFLGVGEQGGSPHAPAWCQRCNDLVTVSSVQEPPQCETCGAAAMALPYAEPLGLGPAEPPRRCPRCDQVKLVLSFAGLWD
jgi:hypothetical protein